MMRNSDVFLNDDEINRKLKQLQNRTTLGILLTIGGGIFLLTSIIPVNLTLLFLGLGLLIAGITVISVTAPKKKQLAADSIIPSVISQVLENSRYSRNGMISPRIIRSTNMGFPFSFEELRGGDYITGTYHGLTLHASDVELVDIRVVHTKNGTHTEEFTEFRGPWIMCDFGKELAADVLLSERTALGKLFAKSGIQTESEAFNKRFCIRSDSEHDAFYLLTPHMMEHILKADLLADGDTYLRFQRNGVVHIAINNGKNHFEVKNSTAEELRQQFLQELQSITDIIDALRLAETIS